MDNQILRDLCLAAQQAMVLACKNTPDANPVLGQIDDLGFPDAPTRPTAGAIPGHEGLLDTAIDMIPSHPFADLKAALSGAKNHLHWKIDDGGFYARNADVGDGYRKGNMHALLVGPSDCPYQRDDFLLGFFLLVPRTLYRDHRHRAPEIYVPLTGPSGWRFDLGNWQDHGPGDVVFNAPNVVHATQVYETPLLALFAWQKDIDFPCEVVPADDWPSIEKALNFDENLDP